MTHPWPFSDPPNLAVITLKQIIEDGQPVLHVTRDSDDGGWQFLCLDAVHEEDARVVALGEMLLLDPTLAELVDLPLGWHAWRQMSTEPWRRAAQEIT